MRKQHQSLAIGITGGIGSGKSEVCNLFISFGATALFADLLARELIDTLPEIKKKVKTLFGPDVFDLDGTLRRKQVAKLIFHDETLKEQLDNIVHPYVLDELQNKIAIFKRLTRKKLIVVEAALIFEAGVEDMFDYIVVVDAHEKTRLNRIVERDHVTPVEVLQRMKAQMSPREKLRRADFTLYNSGDKTTLRDNCKFLYELFKSMTAA